MGAWTARAGIGAAGALALLLAVPAGAGMPEDCAGSPDALLAIDACSALIEAAETPGAELASFHANRGAALASLGDFAAALEDYDTAIEIDPGFVPARAGRGAVWHELGEFDRAIGDYNAALQIEPTDIETLFNRGNAHAVLGQHEAAVSDFTAVLALDPFDPVAHLNRGLSHETLGNFDAAAADWIRSAELGGEEFVRMWQEYLRVKGHRAGAVNGVYDAALRRGLVACAHDPDC